MTPFDWPAPAKARAGRAGKEPDVSEFKRYPVEINGVQTTLRLNERQARARGLWVDDEPAPEPKKAAPAKKQAPKAANKARTAKNKAK